ncbi:MAG: nucleotidyl transferase AbiEii/AbiGii toxin family protein [Clostridiales Family XIII bacterium]|jgi:predicted nucleotidyltransferase component of viral defense system|nr:nucleotidyl transferase AbiEii/AbiGii toxin family protein [Clostridiales Family XIII bacterium]
MPNKIIQDMIANANTGTVANEKRAVHEALQQVALAGMYRAGLFDKASFYGGTCLRIFHGLDRFSEDLDFSLTTTDLAFDLSEYKTAIEQEFRALDCEATLEKKKKSANSTVESAFLKSDTALYNLRANVHGSIKIKIEVDKMPPPGFRVEPKLCTEPFSFYVPCFTLPDLFAGKMHAVLYRKWKTRVKGRDWYDFEWYVRNRVPLSLAHFGERAMQTEKEISTPPTQDEFRKLLKSTIEALNVEEAKADVRPFLFNPQALDIWSNTYFEDLSARIIFE